MNSSLQINISNWNQKIPISYLCPKYGDNHSPNVKWTKVNNTKSYAFILQDLAEVAHNFIHWYVPFIDPSLESISSLNNSKNLKLTSSDILSFYEEHPDMKVKQGINTSTSFGYHGPCAPKGTGNHEYVFYFYALDNDLFKVLNEKKSQFQNDYNNLFNPKTKSEFENLLKKLNVNILSQTSHSGFFDPSNLPSTSQSGSSLNQTHFEANASDSEFESDFDSDNDSYDEEED